MATPSHAQWRRGGGEASLPRRVARIRSVLIYYECADPARGLRGACAEPARNLRLRAARHALVSLQDFDGHLQVTHDSLELALACFPVERALACFSVPSVHLSTH